MVAKFVSDNPDTGREIFTGTVGKQRRSAGAGRGAVPVLALRPGCETFGAGACFSAAPCRFSRGKR
jgi:hypothetical protein